MARKLVGIEHCQPMVIKTVYLILSKWIVGFQLLCFTRIAKKLK